MDILRLAAQALTPAHSVRSGTAQHSTDCGTPNSAACGGNGGAGVASRLEGLQLQEGQQQHGDSLGYSSTSGHLALANAHICTRTYTP